MTRRLARVAACLLTVAAAAALPLGTASAAAPPKPTTPIQHVVMVMQDHRSFDNYFGTREGVEGLPSGVCLPAGGGICVAPFHIDRSLDLTPFNDGHRYLSRQINGGRMDRFASVYSGTAADGRLTMGYYNGSDLPYYWRLADQYVLFDHFFSALPANGVANRYLSVTGAPPPRLATIVPAQGWPERTTIFDRLSAAGLPWKIYVEHYKKPAQLTEAELQRLRARVPLLAFSRYSDPASLGDHIADLEQYFADAAENRLPALSYIVATGPTERPPSSPAPGQRFVRALVTSLQASASWSSSAFFLSYDSSGGWYDHVPPPAWRGEPRGARVPALLVSPFARQGMVESDPMDSTAVLRFVEDNWRLAPLTARDAGAPSLLRAFDFSHARAAEFGTKAATKGSAPWAVIYLAYGGALLFVLLFTRWLRRRPISRVPVVLPSSYPSETGGGAA